MPTSVLIRVCVCSVETGTVDYWITTTTIDNPTDDNPDVYTVQWQLPSGLTCDKCVIQVRRRHGASLLGAHTYSNTLKCRMCFLRLQLERFWLDKCLIQARGSKTPSALDIRI